MDVRRARRVAGIATLVVLGLGATKALVGHLAGSLALQADAVHTLADLLAVSASWFGLTLALRPTDKRFPYGYYRAETLAALGAAGAITFMGGMLLVEGISRVVSPPDMASPWIMMAMATVSTVAAFLISRWEKAAARAANSQSLATTAAETRMDALSSGVVFVSGVGLLAGLPWLDGAAALLIAGIILVVGFKSMWVALLSLMDASVDPELERQIEQTVATVEGVRDVEKMHLRRSGPFYFLDGHVRIAPSMEVARGHEIAHRAQRLVRERFPRVEGVLFHIEPARPSAPWVLIPVEKDAGLDVSVSMHFARSPCYLFARLHEDGTTEAEVVENVQRERQVRAGLAAVKNLRKRRDFQVAIVRDIGEIAYHALRDELVEIFRTDAPTAGEALELYRKRRLEPLDRPTHSSERKLEEAN